MLYCLSRYSKYSLRYGRMTIAVWGTVTFQGESPPCHGLPVSIFEAQYLSDQSDNSQADWCVQKLSSWSFTDINPLVNCRSGR